MVQPILTLNDGCAMPQLGFGLWRVPEDQTARLVCDGLAAGYRIIDDAAITALDAGERTGPDPLRFS